MIRKTNPIWIWTLTIVGVLAALAGLTWGNYRYCEQNPGGNDFLVHWMGTKTFLSEGISPYSDETAVRIQTFAYGRPAEAGEHELRVAYPLYSIVVFLPYALISNFVLARALWMTTLEVALLLLSVVSMRLADWKPRLLNFGLFFLFSIVWYHAVRPIINGNAVVLVALAVAVGLLALKNENDELAGVLLAFSTIKPQVVVVLIIFLLFWTASRGRWKFVGWFLVTLFLLSASVALLLPDWITQNLLEVLRYPGYNPPGTFGTALAAIIPAMGKRIGYGVSGVLAVLLLVEWWISRKSGKVGFVWTACFTIAVSFWIGIQTDPGNFIVGMPALVLVFALWEERWHQGGSMLSLVSMLVLGVGLWIIFLNTLEMGSQPQQGPEMFFPFPAFLLITLYWVRWWAVQSPNVWFERVSGNGNPFLR